MQLTEEEKKLRNEKLKLLISKVDYTSQFLIRDLLKASGYSRSFVYNNELFIEFKKKFTLNDGEINKNYEFITSKNYELKCKVWRKNTGILIAENTETEEVIKIRFKANGKNGARLNEYLPKAKFNTALDKALAKLKEIIIMSNYCE